MDEFLTLVLLRATIPCADMDGFKLLETIALELDIPVISEFNFQIWTIVVEGGRPQGSCHEVPAGVHEG